MLGILSKVGLVSKNKKNDSEILLNRFLQIEDKVILATFLR